MLLKVGTDDLRTGMFVARVDGAWIHSPFWRNKFLLSEPGQIDRLRDAGIGAVFIDLTKGLGPVVPQPDSISPPPERTTIVRERRARARLTRDEFDDARALMDRSRVAVTRMFGEARLGRAVAVDEALPLVDDIAASVARNPSAMIKVTRLKTKNEYTYLHSVAVCALMINLARALGLPEAELRDIGLAGLLHDIGKMATPDAVLDKPGALDASELSLIRNHPIEGHKLIRDSDDVPAVALDVCLHHHERMDGGGYPFGLTGDKLSLYARMGAICDVYDAVTSERAYKQAWSPNLALARMLEWEGHFDTQMLEMFIHSIGIPPLGALVRLKSNHLAIVIDQPATADPVTPPVRRFYSVEDAAFLPVADIATDAGGDRIINLERASYWFGKSWPAIRARLIAGETVA